MTGTVRFKQKIIIFVMQKLQNLGIWGLMGAWVKIYHRKFHICNRRPWFAYIHYATFMGLQSLQ